VGATVAVCGTWVMLQESAVQVSCSAMASFSRFTSLEALTISCTGEDALSGYEMPLLGEETKLVKVLGSERPQISQSYVLQHIR